MGLGVDEAAYFQNLNFALHRIIQAIPRNQSTPPAPPPPVASHESLIERFHKCKVKDFYGTREDDPIVAGHWLRDTLKILRPFHFTSEGNLEC
ncbi:hypothetical protein V6N12_068468 [Hibiscus sabdariffa]|uniref:Uncharacterized protein n=1 Tax=Hibiscus sabdariffa TaxID=183260 RepID=A0ABR2FQ86_9ROSI